MRSNLGDLEGAKADRERANKLTPKLEGDYLIRGVVQMSSYDFEGALREFKAALAINPRSIPALQNQVAILADKLEKPDLESALALATHGCELYSQYAPIRTNRAVILARLQRRKEAHEEIEMAQQLSDDPEITFRAACVYALTSTTEKGDQKKALELLKKSLRKRDIAGLSKEKDLDSLRNLTEFHEIVKAATTLR